MNELRVLFFGMLGLFSLPPLQTMIEAGISVRGVVVPGENRVETIRELKSVTARPELAEGAVSHLLLTSRKTNIVHLAWQHQIPVYEVSRLDAAETVQTLSDLDADVACVACFNKRIPTRLLRLPQYGFFNIHPSLLPQFRGPAPLFWTFRAGSQNTGVTVHMMDTGLDTGDIANQAPLTLPDGISGAKADRITGKLGGQLFVKTLTQLAQGTFSPTPQPSGGSTQPWPQAEDFRIPVSWSAQRAFNFMHGTIEFGQPYVIELKEEKVLAKTAVSYQKNTQLDHPVQQIDGKTWVQFSPGAVQIST